jgi:hypothetical protein
MTTLTNQITVAGNEPWIVVDPLGDGGTFSTGSATLLGNGGGSFNPSAVVLFFAIDLPADAGISTATINFRAQNTSSTSGVKVKIWADHEATPAVPTNATEFWALAKSTSYVLWDGIVSWTANSYYNSPELKDIIQEVVNSHGALTNIQIIIWDNGSPDSCNRNPFYPGASGPTLSITYESATPIFLAVNPVMYSTTIVTLKGEVSNNVTFEERGFDWGLTTSYGESWTETGSYTGGGVIWTHNVGISYPSVIHYRAKVKSGSTWYYGADQAFTNMLEETKVPVLDWNVPNGYLGFSGLPTDPGAGFYYTMLNTDDTSKYLTRGYFLDPIWYAEFKLGTFTNFYNAISYVVFKMRCSTGGGSATAYLKLKTSAGVESSVYNMGTVGGWNYYTTGNLTLDPFTGLAWNVTNLNSYIMMIGLGASYPFSGADCCYMEGKVVYSTAPQDTPVAEVKRIGSIRHIYRPGVYKAEVTLGGLVSKIDSPLEYKPIGKLSDSYSREQDQIPRSTTYPYQYPNQGFVSQDFGVVPSQTATEIQKAIESDNFTTQLIKTTQQLPGGSIMEFIRDPVQSVSEMYTATKNVFSTATTTVKNWWDSLWD